MCATRDALVARRRVQSVPGRAGRSRPFFPAIDGHLENAVGGAILSRWTSQLASGKRPKSTNAAAPKCSQKVRTHQRRRHTNRVGQCRHFFASTREESMEKKSSRRTQARLTPPPDHVLQYECRKMPSNQRIKGYAMATLCVDVQQQFSDPKCPRAVGESTALIRPKRAFVSCSDGCGCWCLMDAM